MNYSCILTIVNNEKSDFFKKSTSQETNFKKDPEMLNLLVII